MIDETPAKRTTRMGRGGLLFQLTLASRFLGELLVVLLAYLLAGAVGLAIPFTSGNVSPVWPASGVALYAIIVFGYRIWPAITVGAFLVNFFTPIPPIAALGIAIGNTAGAVAGAWLLRRVTLLKPPLTRLKDALGLIILAGLGSSAISATFGSLILSLTPVNPWSNFGKAWLMWYLGDAMGVLIIAPLLLTFANVLLIRGSRQMLNFAALLLGTVITCLMIFDSRLGFRVGEDLFAFSVFPFVIWGAIRFQAIGATSVAFVIAVVVVCETAFGSGPFAKSDPFLNSALLQTFLAVISISGMTLAAVNSERVQMIRDQGAQALAEAERLTAQEMEIARLVQVKLLPQRAPALSTLDCIASCVQARAVGGDYFDYLDLGSNRVALVLADVSGKGISAALLMANLQAGLRSQSAFMAQDLPRSMQFVNRLFYECTELGRYATLFLGIYDNATYRFSYVNCGHNPPLLLRDGTIHHLRATATVLGLFETWKCEAKEITLIPSDVLAIYSDGVTEARNAEQAEFSEAGLIKILLNDRHLDAPSILHATMSAVTQFTQGEPGDDATLMVARIR